MDTKGNHAALLLAIDRAGGQTALAEICGCTKQAINQALLRRNGLPHRYVDKVSAALRLPPDVLRADINPAEEANG